MSTSDKLPTVDFAPPVAVSDPSQLACNFDTAGCADAKCRYSGVCLEARRIEIERDQLFPGS